MQLKQTLARGVARQLPDYRDPDYLEIILINTVVAENVDKLHHV